MKMLTVSAFLCVLIALTSATALGPPIQTAKSHLVKRSTSCPDRWFEFDGRCFHFVSRPMTWARAERNCHYFGGNLASIHSIQEYRMIRWVIRTVTYENKETWVGGSDAQEEYRWFWSDGTPFGYVNWCPGEPNNFFNQDCLQINYGAERCWDDLFCYYERPSVCAKEI